MVEAMHARPKATIVLAVLLISAGLTLAFAREALALDNYNFGCNDGQGRPCGPNVRDRDGTVPQRVGELNPGGYGDGSVTRGRTIMMYQLGDTRGTADITYDYNAIDYCNNDRSVVYAHEHAHARGWKHWDPSPENNDAYYPSSQQCRPS